MWAAKLVERLVTLDPWGMYAAGKTEKKNEPRGEILVGFKARTGVDYGRPLGPGTIKEEEIGSSRTGRCAGEPSRGRLLGTYGGCRQEADGRQRRTLLRYVEPMRAVNGTRMVGDVEP